MMRCPVCDSDNCVSEEYNFGVDPETGYCDVGTIARCNECGCESDVEDFTDDSREIHSSGPRAGSH
jgi:hypothetical protein